MHMTQDQLEASGEYGPELLPPREGWELGMWRYRRFLPLADARPILYPHPVGSTPLHAVRPLREATGIPRLWLKDETRGPSCSNKDRATALVLELGLRQGAHVASCASTGNVAISLAVGAAAVGARAVVFVPSDLAESKLVTLLFTGATVVRVRAGYQAAFELSRHAAQRFGWLERNTGVNPATLEAKKTVAFEIWEQLEERVPDVVVVPVGDGTTLCGMAKGFREICACRRTDHTPRLIGVQSDGCRPLVDAWHEHRPPEPVTPKTIADGVAVSAPVLGEQALQDVAASGGEFLAVPDDATLRSMRLLASSAGVIAEPAGALALAGAQAALAAGLISEHEEIVVEMTGSGFKTPALLRSYRQPIDCEGSGLDEITPALKDLVAGVRA